MQKAEGRSESHGVCHGLRVTPEKIWAKLFKKLVTGFFGRLFLIFFPERGQGVGLAGGVLAPIRGAGCVERVGVGFLCSACSPSILLISMGVNFGF